MNGVLDFDGSVRITIEPMEEQDLRADSIRNTPTTITHPTNQTKPST